MVQTARRSGERVSFGPCRSGDFVALASISFLFRIAGRQYVIIYLLS